MKASKTCAIFDLDGTIIRLSSEQVFLRYLLDQGEIPISNLLAWASNFLKVKSLPMAKSNKIHLRGLEQKHLHEIARRCFVETLRPSIAPHISELIHVHRSEGRPVILMSGSLSFLVQPFHEHFQTDLMVSHQLEVVNGRFTGQRVGLHPFAENKAKLAQQLATEHGFDLSASYAYGNHHTDAHKLELFGHPVAVNPDRKLRQIATEKGWQMEK
ncbi:MAG: HAD-IB family hydrolase [Candidatus Poribacteria bacterium]|nr:HAD-IB family hydrolase [Candidatus Poribacteria bacterium]